MRQQQCRSVMCAVLCLVAALPPVMVPASAARSQRPTRPTGSVDPKREQRERELRETRLRKSELGVAVEKRDQRSIEEAAKKLADDFKQIQVIRNELVRIILDEKPFDYKLISDKAAEINKRADRLKAFLIPIDSEGEEKNQKSRVEFNDDEMKGALIQLCNQIESFVNNPVLETPDRVDVEQSTKAGGDLLSIIELSGTIKKSAAKLNKASK
jgi:cytochrome c556